MDFELGVAVAAVLEAKRLELVVTSRQSAGLQLQVPPHVARRVLGPVNPDEGSQAVIRVHAERVEP